MRKRVNLIISKNSIQILKNRGLYIDNLILIYIALTFGLIVFTFPILFIKTNKHNFTFWIILIFVLLYAFLIKYNWVKYYRQKNYLLVKLEDVIIVNDKKYLLNEDTKIKFVPQNKYFAKIILQINQNTKYILTNDFELKESEEICLIIGKYLDIPAYNEEQFLGLVFNSNRIYY